MLFTFVKTAAVPVLFRSTTRFPRIINITKRFNSAMAVPKSQPSVNQNIRYVVADIIKSDEDKRLYRGLELTNGMRVVLISDPTTDKSSAALDVHIGHMSDPAELPGLAHFCEHMLFLGTEKYKSENEYSKFLSEHGGSSNAFTAPDHTNYYFDVTPENLPGALDRFAQFFLQPLFTESATDREVNAVNSEHSKNLQSDMWRLYQLDKATSDPKHDYCKFGSGNKETLDTIPKSKGLCVRDELLKFHRKWYSANIMGLAVLGKESLDELQELVVSLFSGVENKNVTIPEWTDNPWGPDQLKKCCYVVPVKDLRNLNMSFPIPDLLPHYKSSPGHYLSHLIGHEGKGSLLSELKNRGWVNTIVSGAKPEAKGFEFFTANVDLTEDGIENIDEICGLVFQYLNLLRNEGTKQWIFDECKLLGNMTFRFKDKERPHVYTCAIAGLLFEYPLKEVLSAPYLLQEYKPELIDMVLGKLVPDNCRIAVIGKKFECVATDAERWYSTKYKLEPIPEPVLEKWRNSGLNNNLALPPRNDFIPENLNLVDREDEVQKLPVLLSDTLLTRVWFKQDSDFLLPKACLFFQMSNPLAYLDPLHRNMLHILVELLNDSLTEYTYDAALAGLNYSLRNSKYGIMLSVSGYNDKQHILLEKIFDKLTAFEVDPKRFEILKENYVRNLKNFQAEQPHQHAVYYSTVLLSDRVWRKEELLEATDDLTVEGLRAFLPLFLSRLHVECLIHGNVTKQHALHLVSNVERILSDKAKTKPLSASQLIKDREIQLNDGCHFVYRTENSVHRSSCTECYYQTAMQDTNANVLIELFCQVISEPCFTMLRTQEQLGYIVFSGVRRANGTQGLRVLVQSDKQPDYVDGRIEAFLLSVESYLNDMTEEEFSKHREALSARRLEKPKKLSGEASRHWSEISSQQYHFDRDAIEVAHLKSISKKDLQDFYRDLIRFDAPHRHKLSVQVFSTAAAPGASEAVEDTVDEPGTDNAGVSPGVDKCSMGDGLKPIPPSCYQATTISDVIQWKCGLSLCPIVKPYIDLPPVGGQSAPVRPAQTKSKL